MSIPLSNITFAFFSESDQMPKMADILRQHGIIKDMSMMSQANGNKCFNSGSYKP